LAAYYVTSSGAVDATVPLRVPFAPFGRDNSVFLVTFESSDLDLGTDGKRTTVLRSYEAYCRHESVGVQTTVLASQRHRGV